jgi:hypothetical protein
LCFDFAPNYLPFVKFRHYDLMLILSVAQIIVIHFLCAGIVFTLMLTIALSALQQPFQYADIEPSLSLISRTIFATDRH